MIEKQNGHPSNLKKKKPDSKRNNLE